MPAHDNVPSPSSSSAVQTDTSESNGTLPERKRHVGGKGGVPLIALHMLDALDAETGHEGEWRFSETPAGQWMTENRERLNETFQELKQVSADVQGFIGEIGGGVWIDVLRAFNTRVEVKGGRFHTITNFSLPVTWRAECEDTIIRLEGGTPVRGVAMGDAYTLERWIDPADQRAYDLVSPHLMGLEIINVRFSMMKCPPCFTIPESVEDLYSYVERVQAGRFANIEANPGTLRFPEAELQVIGPVHALAGATSGMKTIESAESRFRLSITREGALAESDLEAFGSLGMDEPSLKPRRNVVIDGPYLAWFTGHTGAVVCAALVTPAEMHLDHKNPEFGSLRELVG